MPAVLHIPLPLLATAAVLIFAAFVVATRKES